MTLRGSAQLCLIGLNLRHVPVSCRAAASMINGDVPCSRAGVVSTTASGHGLAAAGSASDPRADGPGG